MDIPSVAGFIAASAGLIALMAEVNVRGWWGFATSWMDLLAVLGWLGLSGWLSWWAFEGAEGWWQALTFLGVVVSVVAVLALVSLLALRLLIEHPDILADDPKQKRRPKRRRRRRRRRSW